MGALFVWASWEKILYPARLAEDVANYAILPPLLVNLWSLFLPWLEMIGGLFLILGFLTRSSSLVLSATLISFIIAISINIARGTQIDCGCFGAGEELGWSTLLRDLLMLAMGVLILLLLGLPRPGLPAESPNPALPQEIDSGILNVHQD